jgi:hypothetical protein
VQRWDCRVALDGRAVPYVLRVSAVPYHTQHGIQVMLIPLEECVLEAMVDGLGRLLSLVQHMVVQKYGSAVALLQLTHTKIATRTIAQYKFTCKQ